MATVDELQVVISAESAKFQSEMGKVRGELDKLNSAASNATSKLSVGMVAAGSFIGNALFAIFAKVGQMIAQQMDEAVTRLDALNNFPRVMGNLGISSKDAEMAIDYLSEKLQGLPTTLDAAALAVQRFASANGNVQASTKMFLAFNNAVLAGGASAEIQKSALEQLSQAYAKGKPDMMEWRTLMMAMPAQLRQIANAMGYVDASALGEALRSGKVSMNEFMNTIVQLNKTGVNGLKSFEEQARGGVAGVQTAIVNLKTAITRAITDVMNTIGQSNIAGFFNGIASAVSTAANYIAAFIRIVLTAINAVRALFGQSAISFGQTKNSADSASTAVGGISTAANNATDAIGGTSKAAKKLQHQLAGFDEMTVLRENASADGGGGGTSAGGVGGVGDLAGLELDMSGLEKSADKVDEIVKRMKKALSGMFDFEKIGKAIKRFAKDVDKFLKPVGKILSDVWDYLKPFISWVGNDLLPAFMNALGGAIALVGEVIGRLWSSVLKPFIDNFLVPIAQFTGGVIVTVLNAIGDALRWLSENTAAVQLITNLTAAIIACKVAVEAFTIAQTLCSAAMSFMTGAAPAIASNMGAMMLQIGSATNNMNMMAAATNVAGMSFGSLKGMLMGAAETIFSPLGIAIGGVTLAITAFQVAQEAAKLASMEAELQERLRIDTEKLSTEATNWNNDAIQAQIDLKNQLRDATSNVTTAELSLLNAQKAAADAQTSAEGIASKYGMTLDAAKAYVKNLDIASGNLTGKDRELAEAVLKLEDAQNRQNEATQKLSDSKATASEKTEQLYNQQWKEIMSMKEAEMAAALAEGKYDEVSQALQDLANSTGEFQLANGEMVKFTKEDIENMAGFIGDQLAKVNDGNGQAWKEIWEAADYTATNLKNEIPSKMTSSAMSAGQCFADGVSTGINNNQWKVSNAAKNSALAAKNAFNSTLQIHSPSRVMKKAGGYFTEGIALGINDMVGDVKASATNVANAANTSFSSNISSFADELKTTSSDFATKNETNLASVVEANAQTQVIVKVGEDTLIDRIVKGINNASFLGNSSVINI